jgi:hypothetical protein
MATATVNADTLSELAALLAGLTFRQQLNLLLRLGVPADEIMGVAHCSEHHQWRPLSDDASLSFEGDVVWCRSCFKWLKA